MRALLLCCAVVALASCEGGISMFESDWRPSSAKDDTIARLYLSFARITAIPKGAFSNRPSAEVIDLMNNNIADNIDVGAFEGVPRLRTLDLSANNISVLPEGVFAPIPALEWLYLSYNGIKEVSSTLFGGLASLKGISIAKNVVELKVHSRAFADLHSLLDISLKNSGITTLPQDMLSNSTELLTLDLSYNIITEIPKHLFSDLKNLEILDLTHNNIEQLDNSVFSGLNKLEKLYLDNNRIKSLQLGVFSGVPNLEELYLIGNDLTISETEGAYPPTDGYLASEHVQEFRPRKGLYSPLQSLRHLTRLDLSKNNISVMCTDWRSFPSLKFLDLSRNNIPHLSIEDMHFQSAAEVHLSHNRIQRFDPYVYDSGRPVPAFMMDHNPYHCTCSVLPFLQKYLNESVTRLPVLNISGATCAEPPRLRGEPLSELTEASVGSCSATVSASGDTSPPELQILPGDSRFGYTPDEWTSLTCRGSNLPHSAKLCLMQYIDGEEIYRNCYLPRPSVRFFFSLSEADDNSNMFCIAEHYVNKDYSHALRLAQSAWVTLHLVSPEH